jgi:hypothetical protein
MTERKNNPDFAVVAGDTAISNEFLEDLALIDLYQ